MTNRSDVQPRFGDVSIYDYANAKVAGARKGKRLSKAVVSSVADEVKKIGSRRDGVRWEQRLDDGDEDDEDGAKLTDLACAADSLDQQLDQPFLELPQDIWFVIGDHIAPEGVRTFAAICRNTRKVTHSVRFWFGLYRRYYWKSEAKALPDRLKPNSVLHPQGNGLRARVIRTLFFMYPPFVERMQHCSGDLQPLLRRKCIATWYTNVQNGKCWTFWFKLKRLDPRLGRSSSIVQHSCFKKISANEEKDCKVLQVSCPHYLPLPAFHGHILIRAQSNVSQDMMSRKLVLHFSSDLSIVLEPASNIQVLDWWHPQYPYSLYMESRWRNTCLIDLQIKDLQAQNEVWYN